MDNKKGQQTAQLRPYDDTGWDRWSMYDNMPYVWDPDLCDIKRLALESGNIIKGYRCIMKEPYVVNHEG